MRQTEDTHETKETDRIRNTDVGTRIWGLIGHNRDYRLLLGAGLVSLTGDAVLSVGLTFSVYALTGSTLSSSLTLLSAMLPQITLGSIAGVLVDRWDHRRTMVVTNLLLAVGLVPLAFVHDAHRIWIVYLVVAGEGVIEQLFAPAQAAMLPLLVTDEDLVAANALNGQNADIARLVGSALGGLIAAAGGIGLIAAVDAATFLAATALLTSVWHRRGPAQTRHNPVPTIAHTRQLRHEWAEGLNLLRGTPALRTVAICLIVSGVGNGVFGSLIAPWVHDVLHRGGEAYGVILAVQAIGGIAGGLATASIGHRFRPQALLGWGFLAFGAIDLALFIYPLGSAALWPAFAFMIIVGTPAAVLNAGMMTTFQRASSEASRGRIIGALIAASGAGMLIGVALAASLPHWIGIVPVLATVQGGGGIVAGVLALARMPARVPQPASVRIPGLAAPEPSPDAMATPLVDPGRSQNPPRLAPPRVGQDVSELAPDLADEHPV